MGTSRLDLVVNGSDISSQIKKVETHESTTDWFIHATLENREPTSEILTKLDNRSVSVKFRFIATYDYGEEKISTPWRIGQTVSAWRLNEEHDGELILYGAG